MPSEPDHNLAQRSIPDLQLRGQEISQAVLLALLAQLPNESQRAALRRSASVGGEDQNYGRAGMIGDSDDASAGEQHKLGPSIGYLMGYRLVDPSHMHEESQEAALRRGARVGGGDCRDGRAGVSAAAATSDAGMDGMGGVGGMDGRDGGDWVDGGDGGDGVAGTHAMEARVGMAGRSAMAAVVGAGGSGRVSTGANVGSGSVGSGGVGSGGVGSGGVGSGGVGSGGVGSGGVQRDRVAINLKWGRSVTNGSDSIEWRDAVLEGRALEGGASAGAASGSAASGIGASGSGFLGGGAVDGGPLQSGAAAGAGSSPHGWHTAPSGPSPRKRPRDVAGMSDDWLGAVPLGGSATGFVPTARAATVKQEGAVAGAGLWESGSSQQHPAPAPLSPLIPSAHPAGGGAAEGKQEQEEAAAGLRESGLIQQHQAQAPLPSLLRPQAQAQAQAQVQLTGPSSAGTRAGAEMQQEQGGSGESPRGIGNFQQQQQQQQQQKPMSPPTIESGRGQWNPVALLSPESAKSHHWQQQLSFSPKSGNYYQQHQPSRSPESECEKGFRYQPSFSPDLSSFQRISLVSPPRSSAIPPPPSSSPPSNTPHPNVLPPSTMPPTSAMSPPSTMPPGSLVPPPSDALQELQEQLGKNGRTPEMLQEEQQFQLHA
ncbi:unnamed protein product [Closterium sp. NIES-64]|nr:unnamed protein product [Closterium sp. NIES-64]